MSCIARKTMIVVCGLFVLVVAAGIAFRRSFAFMPFALGALLGTALNILKIILLDRSVQKVIQMDPKDARNHVRSQHFFRLLLTALAFAVAVLLPGSVSIWGVAAGVCTLQVALLFTRRVSRGEEKAKETTES